MAVADSRVLLVRHAPTPATREAAFPADEPLDGPARDAARPLRDLAPDHVAVSPLQRCRQTATAAGWLPDAVDRRWAELDFGTWAGRTYHDVATHDATRLAAWHQEPTDAPPPGGETLTDLAARVAAALADLHGRTGTTAVVTSGGPIRVAVLLALDAPLAAIWRVAVAPISVTELRAGPDGGWTLVAGTPTPSTSGTGAPRTPPAVPA